MKSSNFRRIILSFACIISFTLSYAADSSFRITGLKVEYTETPLGIDVVNPRFSWQMESMNNQRGHKQSAYQLVVTDEGGKEVWNTGKVNTDISLNVKYAGILLQPTTRYTWRVNVWNQDGQQSSAESWFETGFMTHSYAGWGDAKWIGGGDEDLVMYPYYLTIFRLNFSLKLDEQSKSTRAGFIYGANDTRLMDKNKNLLHMESIKDESYIRIELDIAPLASGKDALLNVYRVGYHPDDKKNVPFKSYPVPGTLINNQTKYDKHTINIVSSVGNTNIYIDGDHKDNQVGALNLNPVGYNGDYTAFPVLADYHPAIPEGQIATVSDIEVRHFRHPSSKIKAGNSAPMLRTTFTSSAPKIAKARLYVTSRGIYEIYLNGKRVGDDYFNPGLTQYNKTHLYQTYDVTSYIRSGKNALGALLAEGWWSGAATYTLEAWNFFGDRQSLLAKLVVTYTNGKEDIIVTNPSTWQYYNKGPIIYGSFFQGEVYDATKEKYTDGWSTPTYNASAWKAAQEISLDGHISDEGDGNRPKVNDYSQFTLSGQFGRTVKVAKELTAETMEEVRPGVFVYDMGQNMVGVPKISLSGIKPGTRITMRFAEVKYPNLPEYKDNVGLIMLENIRSAIAQDIYITKGGNETFSPRFTFHGYRFIEITGIEKPLPVKEVKGVVLSSIGELASHYETSNPKVNKLWENITWSTYGNFLSIPTDCPQRNERMGWSGDISVFSRAATYLANIPQFLRRHMLAMRDVQFEDGRFADVAPLAGGFGGILWGSAGITVAWESYRQYGDKDMLAEHYDAMKRYIHYIFDQCIDPKTNIIVKSQLGDWLGLEEGKNDKSLLWESYFIFDLDIMQQVAGILGKTEDAAWFSKLYSERKAFFNQMYIDAVSGKTIASGFAEKPKKGDLIDIQTSYVLPLAFNVIDNNIKEKVVKNLSETVARENFTDNGKQCPPYSLMTGFIGTAWVCQALSENGYSHAAYRLLQQTSYPSWLYPIEQGATTIWERLNSYTETDGFGGNNSMNSFNHYSFGAVGSWMYSHSLGIQRDEKTPAFRHFVLKPEADPTGKMTYAKGYYDSMYGRIGSSWRINNGVVQYDFIIPANTSATIYLPANNQNTVTESGKPADSVHGVKFLRMEGKYAIFEVGSGKYSFTSKI